MSHRLSFVKPSPAMIVAFAALLAACSGLAVAATSRSPVIQACANKKSGALRLAGKCRHSERSVAWNKEGPPGPTGVTGATGATGKEGLQGKEGPRGVKGDTGQSALTTLQSGQTEHGVIGMANVIGDSEKSATGFEATFATLPIPAPAPLDNGHVLVAGKTDGGACKGSYGSPTAPAGFVCIYLDFEAAAKGFFGFVPDGQPTPYGFGLFWEGSGEGTNTFVEGDWAYTAA